MESAYGREMVVIVWHRAWGLRSGCFMNTHITWTGTYSNVVQGTRKSRRPEEEREEKIVRVATAGEGGWVVSQRTVSIKWSS